MYFVLAVNEEVMAKMACFAYRNIQFMNDYMGTLYGVHCWGNSTHICQD